MVHIAVHPGLQQAALGFATCAAAVHEAFGHMAHFGDVKVRCHRFAIGQPNAQGLLWMSFQETRRLIDVPDFSFEELTTGF